MNQHFKDLTQQKSQIELAIMAGHALKRGVMIVGYAFSIHVHDGSIYVNTHKD